MKVFIWNSVDALTQNWHDGGGLVVIAKDLTQARELMTDHASIPGDCSARTTGPDAEYDLASAEAPEIVFVFPDSGCC